MRPHQNALGAVAMCLMTQTTQTHFAVTAPWAGADCVIVQEHCLMGKVVIPIRAVADCIGKVKTITDVVK